jgi:hypothetical protein
MPRFECRTSIILSCFRGWLQTAFGLVNWITDHVYIPVRTTSKCSAMADLHLYKSPQHPLSLFPACCVFTSRSLATVSVEILRLPALRNSCHSRPCRNVANCQLKYSAISSQPPLKSSNELSTLNWTRTAPIVFFITPRPGPHGKHHSSTVAFMFGNVFTKPLVRNGSQFIRLLHGNEGPCLCTTIRNRNATRSTSTIGPSLEVSGFSHDYSFLLSEKEKSITNIVFLLWNKTPCVLSFSMNSFCLGSWILLHDEHYYYYC